MKPLRSTFRLSGRNVERFAPHIGLVIILALLIGTAPGVLTHYELSLLTLIGIFTLASFALVVLTGHGGILNLGAAGLLAIGAYLGAHFSNEGVTPIAVVGIVLVAGLVVGAIIGAFAMWLGDFAIAIVTFGVGIFAAYGAQELKGFTGGLNGLVVDGPAPDALFYLVWILVGLGAIGSWLLIRSWFGRGLRAMRDDAVAAAMFGLPVKTTRLVAFTVTAPFMTVAGSFYGDILRFISPDGFNLFLTLGIVVIVILGGVTSLWGAVIASALWVMVPEWTASVTGLYYILFGALALILIRWAPRGIAGVIGDCAGWLSRLLLRPHRSAPELGNGGNLIVNVRRDNPS